MDVIIFWKEYTASYSGVAPREVQCESCGASYAYVLSRDVQASARSWFFLMNKWAAETAERRAAARLSKALANGVDPVPCPKCGRFQQDMVREARRRHLGWMSWRIVGPVLFLFPAFALFFLVIPNGILMDEGPVIPWNVFGIGLGVIIGLIALMPFIRPLLALLYDPNNDSPDARIRKGYCGGVLQSQAMKESS